MALINSADQKLVGSLEFSHPPDNAERSTWAPSTGSRTSPCPRGYNINYDAEGVAGGAGFHFPVSVAGEANLDYAYTDMKDLGGVHRFSLTFEF